MVTFQNSVRLGFQHYFDFNSRSTRSEYWWWVLFVVISGAALSIVDMAIGTYNYQEGNGVIGGLFGLITLIPGLALGARRLHDINRSGWWLLMWLICWLIIPLIILLVWAAKPGDDGPNKYG